MPPPFGPDLRSAYVSRGRLQVASLPVTPALPVVPWRTRSWRRLFMSRTDALDAARPSGRYRRPLGSLAADGRITAGFMFAAAVFADLGVGGGVQRSGQLAKGGIAQRDAAPPPRHRTPGARAVEPRRPLRGAPSLDRVLDPGRRSAPRPSGRALREAGLFVEATDRLRGKPGARSCGSDLALGLPLDETVSRRCCTLRATRSHTHSESTWSRVPLDAVAARRRSSVIWQLHRLTLARPRRCRSEGPGRRCRASAARTGSTTCGLGRTAALSLPAGRVRTSAGGATRCGRTLGSGRRTPSGASAHGKCARSFTGSSGWNRDSGDPSGVSSEPELQAAAHRSRLDSTSNMSRDAGAPGPGGSTWWSCGDRVPRPTLSEEVEQRERLPVPRAGSTLGPVSRTPAGDRRRRPGHASLFGKNDDRDGPRGVEQNESGSVTARSPGAFTVIALCGSACATQRFHDSRAMRRRRAPSKRRSSRWEVSPGSSSPPCRCGIADVRAFFWSMPIAR